MKYHFEGACHNLLFILIEPQLSVAHNNIFVVNLCVAKYSPVFSKGNLESDLSVVCINDTFSDIKSICAPWNLMK
jgi:hypothetical protein